MYKTTSERGNFLSRTASHSTKPLLHEPHTRGDEERILAQISDMSLEEAKDFRERAYLQLARVNGTLTNKDWRKSSPLAGREKMRLQLTISLLNRAIKSLHRTAHVLDQNSEWRLAASFTLSLSDAAALEAHRSAIGRYINANGYPPASKQQLEEFMLREQVSGHRGDRDALIRAGRWHDQKQPA